MPEVNTERAKRPEATIRPEQKFKIVAEGFVIQAGIGDKGALTVYGYSDQDGHHSLGQFPLTKYASEWRNISKMIPYILAFIEQDAEADEPRLATRTSNAGTGATVTLERVNPTVAALMAAGHTREKAEELAGLAE